MSRTEPRSYSDACGIARALDAVGERWALLVVRELLLGPKRFTDLRAKLAGISPNVLTQRLAELQAAGVVRRRQLPPPAPATVYELTEWGQGLERALLELGRWGAQSPVPAAEHLSADSLVLSFRTLFRPSAARGRRATVELRLAEDRFVARVSGGRLDIARGEAASPDAIIADDPAALAGAVYFGAPLAATIEGDRETATWFLGLFALPAG